MNKEEEQDLLEVITKDVWTCGHDAPGKVGNPPEPEDPSTHLYIQQHAEEFADFIVALLKILEERNQDINISLEIGIASGGSLKLLRDYVPMNHTVVVDDGKHSRFIHWPRIKDMTQTTFLGEFIGDSHSIDCLDFLEQWRGKFDFVFIDGDHTYNGVRQDILLASRLAAPKALLAFHDTTQVPGVYQAYNEAIEKGIIKELYRNNIRYGMAIAELL